MRESVGGVGELHEGRANATLSLKEYAAAQTLILGLPSGAMGYSLPLTGRKPMTTNELWLLEASCTS